MVYPNGTWSKNWDRRGTWMKRVTFSDIQITWRALCPPRWPGPVQQPPTRSPPATHNPPQLIFHTEGNTQLTQS